MADDWKTNYLDDDDMLLYYDLNNDGIVDFYDFAIFAEKWTSGEDEDIVTLMNEWLRESWLYEP